MFFGLVATAGTTFVQVGVVPDEAWLTGAAAGLLACAVLLATASGAGASTTASLVRDPKVAIGSGLAVYRFTLSAAPGERNDINLTVYPSTGARLTDAAAGVVAGPGCVVNAGELRCDVPAGGSATPSPAW